MNIPMTARVARMKASTYEISYNTIDSYRSITGRVKETLKDRYKKPPAESRSDAPVRSSAQEVDLELVV